ncbi:MAG TPA: hypothetical protein VFI42_03995 [Thermomicrobiaceae bacterium]|nr:hypothetical protein [Thermomicrobiaceae bacterium]
MTSGRRLVPLTIVISLLAWATAQASFAVAPWQPQLWRAGVALVVLGGITPLIYAVNLRVLPLFSGRNWRSPRLLYATIALAQSAWLVFLGRAWFSQSLEAIGAAGCLLAGLVFVYSVTSLVRTPAASKPPARSSQAHAYGDRIGRRFTSLAGLYLLFGLGLGLALCFWQPSSGRWQLVWAHALLVGWFLSMASGICYHVLPRWSRHSWRQPWLLRLHLLLIALGLPVMLLALALNAAPLFAVAGPLEAAALLVFVWNILPLALDLPRLTRVGLVAAGLLLALGVSFGALMAAAPSWQPRLHQTHAELNVFGWAGLLVTAFGYYLFPRLAGQPLRHARLAATQLGALLGGVLLSAGAWYAYVDGVSAARWLVVAGSALSAAGLLGFGLLMGSTFLAGRPRATARKQAASAGGGRAVSDASRS